MIVGITGFKRSGKNSVADVLSEDFGFQTVALADKLRDVLLGGNPWVTPHLRLREIIAQYGWELAKDTFPEVRRLMQDFATEGVRDNLGDDTWLDAWQRSLPRDTVTERDTAGALIRETHMYGHAAAPDVRFPNEVERIRDIGGVIWKVTRPGYLVSTDAHRSESGTSGIAADAFINNAGTLDDLRRAVRAVMTGYGIFAV